MAEIIIIIVLQISKMEKMEKAHYYFWLRCQVTVIYLHFSIEK